MSGPRADRAVRVTLDLPDASLRETAWRRELPAHADPAALARTLRMTTGNIVRTAALARAEAALHGRDDPADCDLRAAARALHSRLLETLCDPVEPVAGLHVVACEPEVRRELKLLVERCRRREELAATTPAAGPGSLGVRALLSGPSGTGKTLAARAVAGELGADLFRLDLASIVDKYLGVTEKNLAKIFDRAEQADVVLLLDEGDALLAQRTSVNSANDRYANLETNYLLQRLERFCGVLLVTTNAGDRIDPAFRRRMDLVVDVAAPGPGARHEIWRAHLPDGHAVAPACLDTLAATCALSGGQIRNAAQHATLLALTNGGIVGDAHVHEAVRREYRKAQMVCPLPEEAPVG